MRLDIRSFGTFIGEIADLVPNRSALQTARCKCLSKYLIELEAASILVEDHYTDGGYLVDYSNYYARCHEEYPRTTNRLHFFTLAPDEVQAAFDALVQGRGAPELQASYLGFVVLKPLPLTIIGRTCLRTYPKKDEKSGRTRMYPIRRTYRAHVYGAELSVESIAFQEQDAEVAACSTTAIWYSMHALPDKFTTREILSPYEITSSGSATYIRRNLGEVTRRFPTSGLALEQIEAYFRSHGLECIVAGMKPENMLQQLKEAVATFVTAGLPMVVVGRLYTAADRNGPFVAHGLHAVTTLGFAFEPDFREGDWSERIARLFAHDDNVGPFSSFSFANCKPGHFLTREEATQTEDRDEIARRVAAAIDTSLDRDEVEATRRVTGYLMNESGTPKSGFTFRRLVPYYYLVAVDPKIRFPYETVYLFGRQLKDLWAKFGRSNYAPGTPLPKLSSSVRLLDAAGFQRYLIDCSTIVRENVEAQLSYPGPRLLWLLSFEMGTASGPVSLLDVVFDATALKQSGGLMTLVPHATTEATAFLSVMLATMRAQKEALLGTILGDLRPALEEFSEQLEGAMP